MVALHSYRLHIGQISLVLYPKYTEVSISDIIVKKLLSVFSRQDNQQVILLQIGVREALIYLDLFRSKG